MSSERGLGPNTQSQNGNEAGSITSFVSLSASEWMRKLTEERIAYYWSHSSTFNTSKAQIDVDL